jgi:hypothetical protein
LSAEDEPTVSDGQRPERTASDGEAPIEAPTAASIEARIAVWLEEGMRHYTQGDPSRALEAWHRILEADPRHELAQQYVAYVRQVYHLDATPPASPGPPASPSLAAPSVADAPAAPSPEPAAGAPPSSEAEKTEEVKKAQILGYDLDSDWGDLVESAFDVPVAKPASGARQQAVAPPAEESAPSPSPPAAAAPPSPPADAPPSSAPPSSAPPSSGLPSSPSGVAPAAEGPASALANPWAPATTRPAQSTSEVERLPPSTQAPATELVARGGSGGSSEIIRGEGIDIEVEGGASAPPEPPPSEPRPSEPPPSDPPAPSAPPPPPTARRIAPPASSPVLLTPAATPVGDPWGPRTSPPPSAAGPLALIPSPSPAPSAGFDPWSGDTVPPIVTPPAVMGPDLLDIPPTPPPFEGVHVHGAPPPGSPPASPPAPPPSAPPPSLPPSLAPSPAGVTAAAAAAPPAPPPAPPPTPAWKKTGIDEIGPGIHRLAHSGREDVVPEGGPEVVAPPPAPVRDGPVEERVLKQRYNDYSDYGGAAPAASSPAPSPSLSPPSSPAPGPALSPPPSPPAVASAMPPPGAIAAAAPSRGASMPPPTGGREMRAEPDDGFDVDLDLDVAMAPPHAEPAPSGLGNGGPPRDRMNGAGPSSAAPSPSHVEDGKDPFAPGMVVDPWDEVGGPGVTVDLDRDARVTSSLVEILGGPSHAPVDAWETSEPPPPVVEDECAALMRGARELFDLGDFSGSLELVEKALKIDPNHEGAQAYMKKNAETLLRMYESKLGDMRRAPRQMMPPDEVIWMNMHHKAGFILSQVDGQLSFEDILEISGMPRFDTMRILHELVQQGIIK